MKRQIDDLKRAGYTYSDLLRTFPGSSPEEIEQRYLDSVLGLYRTVERFGYLGTRPCSSSHFNVNERGERLVSTQQRDTLGSRLGQKVTRVAVFGGSNALGAGLSDSETIPAQIQFLLEEQDSSRRYIVVNVGGMNHTSQHASQRFADRVMSGLADDVAIFLDGWNDCYHAGGSGDGVLQFLNAVLSAVQEEGNPEQTLHSFEDEFEASRSIYVRSSEISDTAAEREFTFLRRRLELALAMREAVSRVSPTRILNYWEPSIYSDFHPSQDLVPRVRELNAREPMVRRHMEAEHKGGLTDIFDRYGVRSLSAMGKQRLPGALFIDGVHPSPLLAKSIAARIVRDLIGASFQGHNPSKDKLNNESIQKVSRKPMTNNPDLDIYPLW